MNWPKSIPRALAALLLIAAPVLAELAGTYTGTYSSADGSEGAFTTTVQKTDAGWDCRFTFKMGDSEITPKTLSCSADDNKLIAEYETDTDGSAVRVHVEGAASGAKLEGTYKAASPTGEVLDSGKWTASTTK